MSVCHKNMFPAKHTDIAPVQKMRQFDKGHIGLGVLGDSLGQ